MCCKGQRKKCWWLYLKYTDGMGIKDIYNPKPSKVRKVQQFSVNDDLIKTFESISEAHREVGVSASMIADCCKNKREIAYGYKWCNAIVEGNHSRSVSLNTACKVPLCLEYLLYSP